MLLTEVEATASGCTPLRVRVISVSDPLPLNLDGTPGCKLDACYTRSFGVSPSFCWYQASTLPML